MNELAVCGRCQAPLEVAGASCPACLFGFGLASAAAQPLGPGFLDRLPEQDTRLIIGQYRLNRVIARGGMGTVYEGSQENLHRTVAIKVITAGAFADPELRQRFRQEAHAAARLQLPNIVTIHETGEDRGQPFIAMEYVDGEPLQDRIRERPMEARLAASILEAVCRGLQHAHEQNVLHRDLKPSNVLLDRDGQPKITDFGIAAVVGSDSGLTRTGQTLGSPGYLPPEQVAAKRLPAGPASDVYSVGATLYYLLTTRPPFAADTIARTLRQVAEDDPVSPRQLNSSIPADLETICLKCLQKQPSRRYATARELGEDLQRFLAGEPIQARKVGPVEKAVRWWVKHPGIAAALAGLIAVMAQGIMNIRARSSEASARRDSGLRQVLLNSTERSSGWFARFSKTMPAKPPPTMRAELQKQMAGALIGVDATQFATLPDIDPSRLRKLPGEPTFLILGVTNSSGNNRAVLMVWNEATDESKLFPIRKDGDLVFGWFSNSVPLQVTKNRANNLNYEFWNLATGERWREFTLPPECRQDPTTALSQKPKFELSLDGRWLTVAHPVSLSEQLGMLFVYDVARDTLTFSTNYIHLPTRGINTTAVSPDGSILVSGHDDGQINLWMLGAGRQWRPLRENGSRIRSLRFFSERRNDRNDRNTSRWLLASRDDSGTVVLWDLDTLLPRTTIYAPLGNSIELSPDGSMTITAGTRVDLWDTATGRHLLGLDAGTEQHGVGFSADQSQLFIAGEEDRVSIWGIDAGRGALTLRGLRSSVTEMCISGDGRRLAAFSRNHEVAVWNLTNGQLLRVWEVAHELDRREAALALNHDGSELAFASDKTVKWWDVDSGKSKSNLWRPRPGIGNVLGITKIHGTNTIVLFRQENSVPGVIPYREADPTVFPRSCRLYHLTATEEGLHRMLDLTNFNHVANSILGSGDGRYFVVDGNCATATQTNRVLSCIDGWNARVLWTRTLGQGHPFGEALRIDASGQLLIVTDSASVTGIWIDLATGETLQRRVSSYPQALGPQGEQWVTWNWDVRERGLLLFKGGSDTPSITLRVEGTWASTPAFKRLGVTGLDPIKQSQFNPDGEPMFSPDGNALAVGQRDGSVLVFRLPEMQQQLAKFGLAW